MDTLGNEELNKVYKFLEEGKPVEARQLIDKIWQYDFTTPILRFTYWCCSYWSGFIKSCSRMDYCELADALITRWKLFVNDAAKEQDWDRKPVYAMQLGIFGMALKAYEKVHEDEDPSQKAELARRKGLCLKKLGKYEEALNCLTEAFQVLSQSAAVLAEMADCFALCGEERNAKVLFREAFFIDAQQVQIDFLDSELICCLIRQVKEKGYSGPVLQEWIPVYGVLYGVFNVKRELRTLEAGKLRQKIYEKENEIKNPKNDSRILVPKLINMYFWLIDHYTRSNEGMDRINECLLQIRVHDENIYRMYTK